MSVPLPDQGREGRKSLDVGANNPHISRMQSASSTTRYVPDFACHNVEVFASAAKRADLLLLQEGPRLEITARRSRKPGTVGFTLLDNILQHIWAQTNTRNSVQAQAA